MKNLTGVRKISQLRLWGKIKGTKSDYYITEGKLEWTEEE